LKQKKTKKKKKKTGAVGTTECGKRGADVVAGKMGPAKAGEREGDLQ